MIIIRPYIDSDKEKVINLWILCDLIRPWNDPYKDINRKKEHGSDLFIILEYKDEIVGTVMAGYDGHRGIMDYLAVNPKFQKRGFGAMLVNEIEEKLLSLGCPKINILVRKDNLKVSKFYEQIDYNNQTDVLLFSKRLIADG
jgi:ribosomal protein S18 acetylase RimI-like enzyme